jgi:Domain of unknown function (DUF4143)
VGIVELWPFSVGEANGHDERFIDREFHKPDQFHQLTYQHLSRADVVELIVRGGFPEPREMSARARTNWFRSYLATVATKDVIEEVGEVRKLAEFRRVLELVIIRTAQEANDAAIASDAGIHPTTVAQPVELLRNLMVVHELPAWASNATTKAKRYAVDSGLAASVLGTDTARVSDVRSPLFEQLLETFVVNELAKQRTLAETEVRLHHFRDRNGAEIDALLVGQGEQLVGIEVKSSASAMVSDARRLASFRDRVGEQFVHGFYLPRLSSCQPRAAPHGGSSVVALGDLTALSADSDGPLHHQCLYNLAEQGFDFFFGEFFVLNCPFRHKRPLNQVDGQVEVQGWTDFTSGDGSLQCDDCRAFRLHANRSKLRRKLLVLHRPCQHPAEQLTTCRRLGDLEIAPHDHAKIAKQRPRVGHAGSLHHAVNGRQDKRV